MSHEVETMAYAGEAPWHGLGVQVEPGLTPAEILGKAGLDWIVEKRPLHYATYEDANSVGKKQLKSHYALVRSTDQFELGISGKEYVPLQNERAFEFFDSFCKAGSMQMETAGSLRGGRYVWALARIDSNFHLKGNDEVGAYILMSQPHVWGKSMIIKMTATRVVCMNTLVMSLNESFNKFRFPHTRDFDKAVMREATEALGLARFRMDRLKEESEFLASKEYDSVRIIQFARDVFQPKDKKDGEEGNVLSLKRTAEEFLGYLETQPGADLASSKGTWWGAYNAVSYMTDHVLGRERDNRLFQAWFGNKAVMKVRALHAALEYARAS